MTRRRLTRQQQRRVQEIQERRRQRAGARASELSHQRLGPEQPGRIVAHHGAALQVEIEGPPRTRLRCVARQNLGPLACGDEVVVQTTDGGKGVIVALKPRRSLLVRPSAQGESRPYAANLDRIFIVAAVRPELSEHLIDHYLVSAESTAIHPVLVLNKVDLLDADERAQLDQRLSIYARLGYPLVFTSAKGDHGLDALRAQLSGHLSVMVGQSGVGKSSLVQALAPGEDIRIGALSDSEHGRHTTSTSVLYHLPFGGALIDSPGVRDFAVWHLEPEQIAHGFVEFRPFLGRCRFRDCSHRHDPGCALLAAVEAGEIAAGRLESYHRMIEERAASSE